MNTEDFIKQGAVKHSGVYTYPRTVYKTARINVVITCAIHGDFEQNPSYHLKGGGCRKCSFEVMKGHQSNTKKTTEQFISEGNTIHGELYTYLRTVYTGKIKPVIVTCAIHGDFSVIAGNHLINKSGCPTCGIEKAHSPFRKTFEEIVESSNKVHDSEYTYVDNLDRSNNRDKITVVCKEHGEFTMRAADHYIKGYKCPKCSLSGTSRQKQSLAEFVKSLGLTVIQNDRSIIKPLELDIVVPDRKIAIEYDGLYFHSTALVSSTRKHLEKTRQCESNGYRLIHVYEDEWVKNTDLVKSRLRNILGVNTGKSVGARTTSVVKLSNSQCKEFLQKHHLQGGNQIISYGYGLVSKEGELVSCMTFCNNRDIVNKDSSCIELTKFCSSTNVAGGFSKLIKAFTVENPSFKTIVSYSDRRWSQGDVYSSNGFIKTNTSNPSYDYCNNGGNRFSKQLFRKPKLKKLLPGTYSDNRTEWEMTAELKLFRIYNCGMDRWELKLS